MYSLKKKESFFIKIIKNWADSKRPNFVNTNPYVMHLICKNDPRFIINARGRAITDELMSVVLSQVEDKEEFILAILNRDYHTEDSIASSPIAMKRMCQICGKAFIYAKEEACTFENFQIAISNKLSENKLEINRVNEYLIKGVFPGYGYFTSKYDLENFCRYDGRFLNLCRDANAIDKNILILALNHEDDKLPNLEILMNTLRKKKSANLNRLMVQTNGLCLLYLKEEDITPELVYLALNNPDPKKRLTYDRIPKKYANDYYTERNYSIMKPLIEQDSRWLNFLKVGKMDTTEIIKILEDCNPLPKKFLQNVYWSCGDNLQVMEKLVAIDGVYALPHYSNPEIITKLIDKALTHTDPNKTLTYNRFTFGSHFECSALKKLIDLDSRWINKAIINTIDEDTLIQVINASDYKYIPPNELIIKFAQNEKVVNAIIKQNELGKYTTEDIKMMLSSNMSQDFINTKFFNDLMKRQCEINKIDYNFFFNFVKQVIEINEDVFSSINFELLQEKYHKLYLDDGYEKLLAMAAYPDIQDKIVRIGNYKNLGEQNILLLSKMLDYAYKNKNGEKVEEWVSCYSKIITAFEKNLPFYSTIALQQDKLDILTLSRLTMYSIGNHHYKITSIEDLQNYEKIREAYIEKKLNSNDFVDVKEGVLEKVFGISYETANEIYSPYCEGILRGKDIFEEEFVLFFKQLKTIMEIKNLEELRKVGKNFNTNIKLDVKDYLHLGTMIKKRLVKEYNKTLYKPSGIEDDLINGIKLYKVAGKDGSKPFNLSVHVLGAYSNFSSEREGFNYHDNWTRPLINNHGICTSYIGNNHLGVAEIENAVLGFTDYEYGSLLLAGPRDIYSANSTFDIMSDESSKCNYLLPSNLIDSTRVNHNELVYERRIGTQKRMPSYIVYFCDDYDKAKHRYERLKRRGRYEKLANLDTAILSPYYEADMLHHTLKAAEDFGVPIVVVERKKIAKKERERIDKTLREFITDSKLNRQEVKRYLHDTLTDIGNNYVGNSSPGHSALNKRYFNEFLVKKTMFCIKRKIIRYMNSDPLISLMIIEELTEILESEKKNHGTRLYSPYPYLQDINKIKNKILSRNKDVHHISPILNNTINDESHLIEYNSQVKPLIGVEQYNLSDINSLIKDDVKNKVFLTINEIDNDDLYPKEDIETRRHIENVLLFSGIIATQVGLSNHDIDLLLLSSLYHDIGKRGKSNHALSSSLVAHELLKDKYEEQDIKIVQAIIEYHEETDKEDIECLEKICSDKGIDSKDEELMKRIKKIAHCLKDANNLDKTRYLSNSNQFLRQDSLYFDVSKKLIKPSMQINEYYAYVDMMNLVNNKPELYSEITSSLEENNNPKKVIKDYREIPIINEGNNEVLSYGK